MLYEELNGNLQHIIKSKEPLYRRMDPLYRAQNPVQCVSSKMLIGKLDLISMKVHMGPENY